MNLKKILQIRTITQSHEPVRINLEKRPVELRKPKFPSKEKIVPEKEFIKIFNELSRRHRPWDIWKDFVVMYACALSNAVDKTQYAKREERYLKLIKKYNKWEQSLFPKLCAYTTLALEDNPEQDFLGNLFMKLNFANSAAGQFFTSYNVCKIMSQTTLTDITTQVKKNGYVTINDCACGAGATLIASINKAKEELLKENINFQNHVLIVAQDIDEIVGLMCYIQISLLGVAGYVKIGNSLTDPIVVNDNKENYWFTPIYFTEIWRLRRIFKGWQLWQV